MDRQRRQASAHGFDPRGAEPGALCAAVDLTGKRVLEIGAGDGRLTFRYAPAVGLAVGIDPARGGIFEATAGRPAVHRDRLRFLPACALALPFRQGTFDVALLAWSL